MQSLRCKWLHRNSMKKSKLLLILLILSLFSSCDWNLYTKLNLIDPTITITTPATVKTDSSFNLLSIASDGIEKGYSIKINTEAGKSILKGQNDDSIERFIEALSYLEKEGKLETILDEVSPLAVSGTVHDTLNLVNEQLKSLTSSIDKLDQMIQELLELLSSSGVNVPEIHYFRDLSETIETLITKLEKEKVLVKDYLLLQYYIDILSSLFRLSEPIIDIVSDGTKSLTIEQVKNLINGDGLTEEMKNAITKTLQDNSLSLSKILLDSLAAIDQSGKLLKAYIPVQDLSGVIKALRGVL